MQEQGVVVIIGRPAFLPNISICMGQPQISASLHQPCKSNGIMLLMLTLATLSFDLKVPGRARWICRQCPHGYLHSWSATINNRTNGNDCPQCSGHKVCKHSSLATKAPGVAAQWDYEENDSTPDTIAANSNRVVGWLCDVCSHKWTAAPHARVNGKSGCPQCALSQRRRRRPTFAESQHPLLAEWDHRRNSHLNKFPHNTRLQSNKQIWWLCTKCPAGQEHSWSAPPYSRTRSNKSGCAVCAGRAACRCNSLQALYPDIAAEWDHSKNEDQPSDYAAMLFHLAWWASPQRGSWQQTIHSRTNNIHQSIAKLKRIQQRQSPASWPEPSGPQQ